MRVRPPPILMFLFRFSFDFSPPSQRSFLAPLFPFLPTQLPPTRRRRHRRCPNTANNEPSLRARCHGWKSSFKTAWREVAGVAHMEQQPPTCGRPREVRGGTGRPRERLFIASWVAQWWQPAACCDACRSPEVLPSDRPPLLPAEDSCAING